MVKTFFNRVNVLVATMLLVLGAGLFFSGGTSEVQAATGCGNVSLTINEGDPLVFTASTACTLQSGDYVEMDLNSGGAYDNYSSSGTDYNGSGSYVITIPWTSLQTLSLSVIDDNNDTLSTGDTYTIPYQVSNHGTGSSSTGRISLKVYNTSPTVTMSYPTGGLYLSGTIYINWTITDPAHGDYPMSTTISYSTGGGYVTLTGINTARTGTGVGSGTYAWNTSGFADGTGYRVRIMVEDDFGSGTFTGGVFTIDNTVPAYSNDSPAYTIYLSTGVQFDFSGIVTDPTANIILYTLVFTTGSYIATGTSGVFHLSKSTLAGLGIGYGTHYFTISVMDASLNSNSTSVALTVIPDVSYGGGGGDLPTTYGSGGAPSGTGAARTPGMNETPTGTPVDNGDGGTSTPPGSTNGGGQSSPISYDTETQDAYNFAYENGITTISSLEKANPYGAVLRKHAAKMFVEFARSVGKTTVVHEKCIFTDISKVDKELSDYILEACRLGLMGQKADGTTAMAFNPEGLLTRAEFGTILSRILYGNEHNSSNPADPMWYAAHLKALKDDGYIKMIDTPLANEKRVYARIMFMRVYEMRLAENDAYDPAVDIDMTDASAEISGSVLTGDMSGGMTPVTTGGTTDMTGAVMTGSTATGTNESGTTSVPNPFLGG